MPVYPMILMLKELLTTDYSMPIKEAETEVPNELTIEQLDICSIFPDGGHYI